MESTSNSCPPNLKHEYLKDMCRKNKLSTCGRKQELYARLVKVVKANIIKIKDKETETDYEKMKVVDLKKECKSRGL